MKTPEELNAHKEGSETLKKDVSCLNEEDLAQVAGGGNGSAPKYIAGQFLVSKTNSNSGMYIKFVYPGEFAPGFQLYYVFHKYLKPGSSATPKLDSKTGRRVTEDPEEWVTDAQYDVTEEVLDRDYKLI